MFEDDLDQYDFMPPHYKEAQWDCSGKPNNTMSGCSLIKNFVRPPLSEIWVPAYLLDKSLIPGYDPKTLDDMDDVKPKFSVIEPKYLNVIPDSVKAIFAQYPANQDDPILDMRQATTAQQSTSTNSSTGNMKSRIEDIDDRSRQIGYRDAIPYRKKDTEEKQTNERAGGKKSKRKIKSKNQKSGEDVSLKEMPNHVGVMNINPVLACRLQECQEIPSQKLRYRESPSSSSSSENVKCEVKNVDCGSSQNVHKGKDFPYQKKEAEEKQMNGKARSNNKLRDHQFSEGAFLKERLNHADVINGDTISAYESESCQEFTSERSMSQMCVAEESTSQESPSSSSSLENIKTEVKGVDYESSQIVYNGVAVPYQKKEIEEKQANGKVGGKKNKRKNKLKNHKAGEGVFLKEMPNHMDVINGNTVSTYMSKSYSLDIVKSKCDGLSTQVEQKINNDSSKKPMVVPPVVVDCPTLANQESSVVYSRTTKDLASAVLLSLKIEDNVEKEDIIVVENISAKINRQDLQDFLDSFGEMDIIKEKRVSGKLSLEFKTDLDSNWLIECIDGQQPFGAYNEPFRCFVK